MKFLIMTLATVSAFANFNISCETPRQNVKLKIEGNNLILSGRNPAQTQIQRTKFFGSSLTKVFYLNGQKHTVFVKDTSKFDNFEDYLTIKSREGHEMTYPITCEKV